MFVVLSKSNIVDRKHWKRHLINEDSKVNEEIRRKIYMGRAFVPVTIK